MVYNVTQYWFVFVFFHIKVFSTVSVLYKLPSAVNSLSNFSPKISPRL